MVYRCPKCGCEDNLAVEVKTWATLIQNDAGEVEGTETSPKDDAVVPTCDHDWGDESPMQCMDCGYNGKVLEFDPEDEKDAKADSDCENHRQKTLTTQQIEAYVASGGTVCPFCSAELEIEGGMFQADGGTAWQEVSCTACEAAWDDIYHLTGIEPGKYGEWEAVPGAGKPAHDPVHLALTAARSCILADQGRLAEQNGGAMTGEDADCTSKALALVEQALRLIKPA